MLKTKILLILALLTAGWTAVLADDASVMWLHLKDGRQMRFVIPVQQPHVSCHRGAMTIAYREAASAEAATMTFARDEVERLTFGDEPDAIGAVTTPDRRVTFDLTRRDVLLVSGLADSDRLQVCDISGKPVQPQVSRSGCEAVVDLTTLPRSCYVVSVNHCFTFKLMKP